VRIRRSRLTAAAISHILSIERILGKDPMAPREFKDALYTQFARIGQALASPKRIELLDLLAQGEKTVEQLAEYSAMPVKNTSAHLRALRHARLVETRRDGTHIYYRVAGAGVGALVRSLEELGRERLAEVEQVARHYLEDRDEFEPVTLRELSKLLRSDDVTVIDVRPAEEYEAGHIPGAISIPVSYCVYALEAVTLLRKRGYRARRADEGLPEWRARGQPVATGTARRQLRTVRHA
jgi:DNA-binding transcriptional ArsR family regulator